MSTILKQLLIAVLSFSIVLTQSGCATTNAIPLSEPSVVRQSIVVGDQVEIKHINGRVYKFTVSELTDHSISGNGNTLLWDSVESIGVRKLSADKTAEPKGSWKTGAIILGVAAVVAIVLGIRAVGQALGEGTACIVSFDQADECKD